MTLIVQLTDLHVRPTGLASSRVVETTMLTERALRAVARLQPAPDAILLTGDLTECGLAEEYAVLAEMLARLLAVPVHAIPGNHDRRERLLAGLPGTRQADGFVQYTVEDLPVRLVMLDTVVPGAGHGELCQRRLDWLDATLAAAAERPTLLAMHHPPFVTGIVHMDAIMLQELERLRAVLERYTQVQRIVCGHHHRAITARFAGAIASVCPSVAHQVELDLRSTAPAAFRLEPPAFQLHRWTLADGFVSHIAFVEDYPGPFPFLDHAGYPGGIDTKQPRSF